MPVMQGSLVVSFTSAMLFVSNSCVPDERGRVNGLCESTSSFTRMIAPYIGGMVFAWSEQNGGFDGAATLFYSYNKCHIPPPPTPFNGWGVAVRSQVPLGFSFCMADAWIVVAGHFADFRIFAEGHCDSPHDGCAETGLKFPRLVLYNIHGLELCQYINKFAAGVLQPFKQSKSHDNGTASQSPSLTWDIENIPAAQRQSA